MTLKTFSRRMLMVFAGTAMTLTLGGCAAGDLGPNGPGDNTGAIDTRATNLPGSTIPAVGGSGNGGGMSGGGAGTGSFGGAR